MNDPIPMAFSFALSALRRAYPTARLAIFLSYGPEVHDSYRHFARTYKIPAGIAIVVAPELAELPYPFVVGVILHEFGHAVVSLAGLPVPLDRDELERHADQVAEEVFGLPIGYVGGVQCIGAGVRPRPRGLR